MPKGIDGRLLWRRTAPLLVCLLVAAGCGDSGDSDSSSASASTVRRVVQVQSVKQDRWTYARGLFNEMCAGCHTLADAGARGRRYNFDHAGGQSETHVRSTIAEGEPGMPRFRDVLSRREFEELVAYVTTVAAGSTPGDDYWHSQLMRRIEGEYWTPKDTEKLERFARRLISERTPTE